MTEPLRALCPNEIHELARDVVTGRGLLLTDPKAVKCAFLILIMLRGDPLPQNIGAFYGDFKDTLGRSLNRWPMFHTARMIAAESLPAVWDEIDRLTALLAPPPEDAADER